MTRIERCILHSLNSISLFDLYQQQSVDRFAQQAKQKISEIPIKESLEVCFFSFSFNTLKQKLLY